MRHLIGLFQNNLERSDFERNTQFTQRIEMLDKENAGLKRKLDGIDTQHRSFIKTLEVTGNL